MANLYDKKPSGMIRTTDFKYVDRFGKEQEGFMMNRLLYNNVIEVPKYLSKDNALIGIVSGMGMTRIGKSFMGFQLAYAIAWHIAGGQMNDAGEVIARPTKPVVVRYHFDTTSLSNEIANNSEDYQVYLLDEGEAGAGSRAVMNKRAKDFRDLIIRSALKKYVLIIISPDFFNLSSAWACTNSDFLINVYTVCGRRGHFNFYNRDKKSQLYYWGKKQVGDARYGVTWPVFHGTFPNVFPGDFNQYNIDKQKSLLGLTKKQTSRSIGAARDAAIKLLHTRFQMPHAEIADVLGVSESTVETAIWHNNLRNAEESLIMKGGNPNGEQREGADSTKPGEVCGIQSEGEDGPIGHEEERALPGTGE